MNRLQHETSPYLLQHAHNPVDWYAWKPEAFERARREDKPIIVSIGYSTCHWCHVMERESFEDADTAAFMNEHFINIKVDREERPDVDQIYMEACQAISGSGGWPLNCFLTPDGRPFFAGTYYPPRPAYNRPSWMQVLINMYRAFRDKRPTVEEQADRLVERIQGSDRVFVKEQLLDEEEELLFTPVLLQNMYHGLAKTFDARYGGFGGAPKFPATMTMQYLLRYYHHYQDPEALQYVTFTLNKMSGGGIYDQLGGGFARYATDAAWLIPHFEKMLYDNALLAGVLSEAYLLTRRPQFADTIRRTLEFIEREMTHPDGGFYSALDADSEGEEGKFYVWQKAEIDEILGEESELFCAFYGVSEEGNWEGTNILWRPAPEREFAEQKGMSTADLRRRLAASRDRLFAAREKRIRPGRDEKVILGWNALQCTAYAKAYLALGEESCRERALRNLEFIFEHMQRKNSPDLYHTFATREGENVAQYDAFLDDYAFLIEALLQVYQITFDEQWLIKAREYAELVLTEFADPESKLFFYTHRKQQDIILRKKEIYDSAQPSGNAVMAVNLLKLAALTGQMEYREHAREMLRRVREAVEKYPSSFSRWAEAMALLVEPLYEIAVVGPEAMTKAIDLQRNAFLPNSVVMAAERALENYPLLAGRGTADGRTLIYVCQDFACQMPVSSVAEAIQRTKASVGQDEPSE
jgi:uncharacterized protein YyaL (SSP411 family)